jgi:hypothetical protein
MSRRVTTILVDGGGAVLGALPPFDVVSPWWPEVGELVAMARERYGVAVTVLRLVASERPAPPGGAVSYLAQVDGPPAVRVPLSPATVDLCPHPLRAPYAQPGGPDASLRWAADELRRLGHDAPVAVAQRKTWNLSGIWQLDIAGRGDTAPTTVWLKHLPRFLRQETAVLAWLTASLRGSAPTLLAADGEGRQLLAHTPGEDRFSAPVEDRYAMVALLHTIQLRAVDAVEDLIAAGVPDLRDALLADRIRAVAAHYGEGVVGLRTLLDGLDVRLAAVRRCGLPDTLVHEDFHPGNVRNLPGGRCPPVILDWGDAFIGNPGFDALRMVDDLDAALARPLLDAWQQQWRTSVPGSDPATALNLLRPVAPLLHAVVYANFLANIEPSEHPYHAADVPNCLNAAVRMA